MRDLWRNIGATGGARTFSVLVASLSLIVSARALGPSGRGTMAAAVTWSLLFSTVGYLSLGQVAIHRKTRQSMEEWLGPTLAALLFMTAAISVIGWIVAAVVYIASDGRAYGHIPVYALVLGFATLPFLVWEQYGSSMLSAVGRLSFYNRAEIVGRTVGIALIVLFLGVLSFGVAGGLVALLIAQMLIAGAGWRYLIRLAGPTLTLKRSVLRDLIAGGVKLHLAAVGTFLFANAAVLIVQSIKGPSQTGPFQAAIQVLSVGVLVPQAASLVLYGEIARDGPDKAWAANRRVLVGMMGFMAVAVLVGFLLAPVVIPLLFGNGFRSAVPVFRVLVFGLFGQCFSAVMAPQWIGRGLFWQGSLLTLAMGLCNVLACILLVDAHGMMGAAYSLLGIYTLSVVGNGAMALWVNRRASTVLAAA